MKCPFCGKETLEARHCQHCGGDVQWAIENNVNFNQAQAAPSMAGMPGMMPGMPGMSGIGGMMPGMPGEAPKEQSAIEWLQNSSLPQWIKDAAIADELKRINPK